MSKKWIVTFTVKIRCFEELYPYPNENQFYDLI